MESQVKFRSPPNISGASALQHSHKQLKQLRTLNQTERELAPCSSPGVIYRSLQQLRVKDGHLNHFLTFYSQEFLKSTSRIKRKVFSQDNEIITKKWQTTWTFALCMLCACCHCTADLIKIKLYELKGFSLLFSCDIGLIYVIISGQQSNVSCDLKKLKEKKIKLNWLSQGNWGNNMFDAQDPELLRKRRYLNPF